MKTGKRILSIFLAVLMLLTAAPLAGFVGLEIAPKAKALDATGQCGDNVFWSFDKPTGALTISGEGAMRDYNYESSPFKNHSEIKSITISNGVTSIGDYTFYRCSSLTSVMIPDSVTSIGHDAFFVTALYRNGDNWSNGVLYICNHLIKANSTITDCSVRKGTKSIADYAFEYCRSLTSVTIPDSVTSIGYSAFENCSRLTRVDITDVAAWCSISFENEKANPLYYAHNLYLNETLVADLNIPNSVTSIGKYAFYDCRSLTSVTIPNSVTSIGGYAFADCSSLTSLTIPNSVTSIGQYAFAGCSSLTSVTIPNSVTNIGRCAFYDCSSLTSVTIPNSVTNIGEGAFDYCRSLKDVYYTGSEEQWKKISISAYNDPLKNATIHYNYVPVYDFAADGKVKL